MLIQNPGMRDNAYRTCPINTRNKTAPIMPKSVGYTKVYSVYPELGNTKKLKNALISKSGSCFAYLPEPKSETKLRVTCQIGRIYEGLLRI
jgi:hypothetical protein